MRVAVVGCGAMGAAAGWRLGTRGIETTCFDRFSPPHDLGSSHGETRIIRTAYYEGPGYVPLVEASFPLWRELESGRGDRLLTMTGALMIGAPGSDVITGSLAAAREHDLDIRALDAGEVRSRYPGHVLLDTEVGVLDIQAGFLRPEAAVAAMVDRLIAFGGSLHRDREVTAINSLRDGVEVVSPAGRQTFDRVVVAAGAYVPRLLPWMPVAVERQTLAWFVVRPGAEWLTADRFPVYLHGSGDLGDIYGFPTLDGRTVKLGGHHGGEPADPDTIVRTVSDADLAPLRTFIATRLRGVTDTVARTAVCMYTNTPDRHFIIDVHPHDTRIVIVSACSGHGFKFAPVIGEIAADLAIDGGTARDIGAFSLHRFPGLDQHFAQETQRPTA